MNTKYILGLVLLALRLAAAESPTEHFPVRGLSIAAPSASQVDRFTRFIRDDLAPRAVNTLILRVDYNFQYTSHPDLGDRGGLSQSNVQQIAQACRAAGIRVVPQINLLGHQSWANRTGKLLQVHPEFDETPWVQMPEKYAWPNPDRLYCKSYCPLHPDVHGVVFTLVDELCDAFDTDAFHAGMDEVFYLGEDKCPRCTGKNKAELFAGEVKRIRDHLTAKNRQLWIWSDRLLDGKTTGLGEWEASLNETHGAIDLIPKDIVLCDWHYERAEQTAVYLALNGFPVVTCPWKKQASAVQQVQDIVRFRSQSAPVVRDRILGILQTAWSGAGSFLADFEALRNGTADEKARASEAACFLRTFDEIAALRGVPAANSR